jgi:hypothetical protein
MIINQEVSCSVLFQSPLQSQIHPRHGLPREFPREPSLGLVVTHDLFISFREGKDRRKILGGISDELSSNKSAVLKVKKRHKLT